MSALEEGARVIERAVEERSGAHGVAIVRQAWNGDEGLKPAHDTQTLVVSATQSGGRAAFTNEQLAAAAGGELPPEIAQVIERLLDDVRAAAESGEPPPGGGG